MTQTQPTPTLRLRKSVFHSIKRTVGSAEAETGGYLFGSKKDYVAERFVFDDQNRTSSTWTFNPGFINPIIKKLWEEEHLELIGFVHSHPAGFVTPSSPDVRVFQKYIDRLECDQLLVPIIQSSAGKGGFQLYPYLKFREDDSAPFHRVPLEILPNVSHPSLNGSPVKTDNSHADSISLSEQKTTESVLNDFSRIEQAVDVEKMKKSRVFVVGAGGAFSLYDSLARTGIGSIIACDFDTVDSSNLVRQGYFLRDIEKKKVLALKEHLKEVNPELEFIPVTEDITTVREDELDDLVKSSDILLFLTDSFKAQAFGNLLSQKYRKPAIWGGYYTKSRCAEIVFYIPGVTPGCFRCAVSSRYKAQKENPVKISSNCNTIFHSQLLDAYIGMVMLAILHNDTTGFEFSNWFGHYWENNLIQIKVNPAYSGYFGNRFPEDKTLFNFPCVWQKIEQEVEPQYDNCPDCVGTMPVSEIMDNQGKLLLL